jgi:hypothetical protein
MTGSRSTAPPWHSQAPGVRFVKWFGPGCRRGYWPRHWAGGWSARGCEVVGMLLQEGFELVNDHLIPWDERAVAGVELLEEVVAGRALCFFDEFGDVAQLEVAEAARG